MSNLVSSRIPCRQPRHVVFFASPSRGLVLGDASPSMPSPRPGIQSARWRLLHSTPRRRARSRRQSGSKASSGGRLRDVRPSLGHLDLASQVMEDEGHDVDAGADEKSKSVAGGHLHWALKLSSRRPALIGQEDPEAEPACRSRRTRGAGAFGNMSEAVVNRWPTTPWWASQAGR